jgi:hypothetical protein
MHHRGLGMRTLGRLAMAAALIVPVGAVAATSSAGAATNNHASCSGTGAINSQTTNNGVGDNGGLLYSRKGSQQFKGTGSGTCTGGVVTSNRVKMTVTTKTAVNCQTIGATTLGGSGTFTWNAGMGTSNFNVQWRWTSDKTIHISGSVSAGGSQDNTFGGNHISGNITTAQSLKTVASGGNCSAVNPLKHFDITNYNFKV